MSKMPKNPVPFKAGVSPNKAIASAQSSRAQGVAQVRGAMANRLNDPSMRKMVNQPGKAAQAQISPAVKQIAAADKTLNKFKGGPSGPTMGAGKTPRPTPTLQGAPKVQPKPGQPLVKGSRKIGPF